MSETDTDVLTETPAEPGATSPAARGGDAAPDVDVAALAVKVEAALITAERALLPGRIAEALGLPASKPVLDAVALLNEQYEATGRSFRIESVAGGLRVLTLPAHGDVMSAMHQKKDTGKLSPAALETLSIVAYKQPVLRTDVEAIRGVACGEVLRALMERHLVKIVGRAEEVGRPMLYGTTKQFLEVFGLSSLKDLPKVEELA